MKTIIYIGLILTGFMFLSIEETTAQSNCVACYHHGEEQTCKTEYVERDAAESCGCDTGCSCSGLCEYEEEPVTDLNFELNKMEVPESGLKLIISEEIKESIFASLTNEGYVGSHKLDNVWFDKKIALYKLTSDEYLIFPVRDRQFALKDCAGELMANIAMK